jgi:hypothetical protein
MSRERRDHLELIYEMFAWIPHRAGAAIHGMGPHLRGCPAWAEDHEGLRELAHSERVAS